MPSRSLSTVIRAVEDSVRRRGLFTGDALELAKTRLVGLLDATVIVRSTEKDETGRLKYKEVPDNAIRLAAAVKLIELETGKAPQTVDVATTPPGGDAQKAENPAHLLARNPELLGKILDFAAKAARKPEIVVVHEVTATPTPPPPDSQSTGAPSAAPPS